MDDQKTDGATIYKQILIHAKIKNGKRGKKTELTGRSPLRRRRSAMDCSATEEEEEKKEEEKEEGRKCTK